MKTKKIVYIGSSEGGTLGFPQKQRPFGLAYKRGEPIELEEDIADELLGRKGLWEEWKPQTKKVRD